MDAEREINFTGGMPDPDSFPVEGLIAAAQTALRRVGGKTLVRYPGDRGEGSLREVTAERFHHRDGVAVSPNDIAITNGSMQAIDLTLRAFVKPGDTVICEEITYMGTLGALRHYGARLVGVPVDRDGMDTDALSDALRDLKRRGIRPSLLYTVPTNQNPTGANLSRERRHRLVELAEEYDVPVLEDDCYDDIHFEARSAEAMYGFAPAGRVVYVGTFSKVIGPGMRLGYLIAPPERMATIMAGRYDGGTSAFASVILAEYLREHMWEHVAETNAIVRAKRDALLNALKRELGDDASCVPPTGGLFAWVRVPDATDMDRLMREIAARRVLCTRGQVFRCDGAEIPYVRFCYGYPTLDEIAEGIARFAECLRVASPRAAAV